MNITKKWGPYKAVLERDGSLRTHLNSDDPLLISQPGRFFEHNHAERQIVDVYIVMEEGKDAALKEKHSAQCPVCARTYESDEPICNVFCPGCKKDRRIGCGVLYSDGQKNPGIR